MPLFHFGAVRCRVIADFAIFLSKGIATIAKSEVIVFLSKQAAVFRAKKLPKKCSTGRCDVG